VLIGAGPGFRRRRTKHHAGGKRLDIELSRTGASKLTLRKLGDLQVKGNLNIIIGKEDGKGWFGRGPRTGHGWDPL